MSFPRYPEYKDSGVEWLGEVPGHWQVVRFRHLFTESSEKIEAEIIGEMLSVSGYRGIELKEYDDDNRRRKPDELLGYRVVRPGQLVVNTMWLNYGGLGVSEHEGHVSPAYRSYWIKPTLNKKYVHHMMRSGAFVKGYTIFLTGIRPNSLQMSRDDLMAFEVLEPPEHEQAAIAAFLDRETARIDALVAEQQKLIALLKEKRQALISHAVTKGLDPDVPMKDSGVAWLGEVPRHWDVKALKQVISRIESGVSVNAIDTPAEEGEIGVLKTSCVYRGWFDPAENKSVLPEEYVRVACPVTAGTLIVSRMNTPDLVGAAGMVGETHPNLFLPDRLWQVHFSDADTAFVHYWTHSPLYRSQVQQVCAGTSSSMQNLAQDQFRAFTLALPPVPEQKAIAAFLDRETVRIDDLVRQSGSTIHLLHERRTALISAAVTGKIDVRHLAVATADRIPEPA